MNASRELDTLVATKVMGWHWRTNQHGAQGWATQHNEAILIDLTHWQGWVYPSTPRFSEDIDAAWAVVETMHARIDPAKVGAYNYLALAALGKYAGWAATFGFNLTDGEWWDNDKLAAVAPTAPHAICLAALRAVGVDV